jgi:DNA-binding Lrp family transcriptional regulator
MKINIPDISKQIYHQDTLRVFIDKYSQIGPQWTIFQMEWFNGIYKSFKDHDKYLIIIHLLNKTLDFYSRNFVKLNYEDYFLRSNITLEKFNISDISNDLNIPKESTRRKLVELEKNGIIKRDKKKIIIERTAFSFVKPINSITRISSFLSLLSKLLSEEKILLKPLPAIELEKIIKKNFSYIWKLFYEMQIPMLLNYKKKFNDIETFHIFGACVVNQHLNMPKKEISNMSRLEFIKSLYTIEKMSGISAMSISDITGIPRATVVRKLKKLVIFKNLSIDDKKHYKLTGVFIKKLAPLQEVVLSRLSIFATKIFNLAIL